MESGSTRAWVIIHIELPTLPSTLSGFIRLVITSWRISWGTFSASELAICVALLALFLNQSLIQHEEEELLDNDDKEADTTASASACLVLAVILLISFALIVAFETITSVYKVDLNGPVLSVEEFVYLFSICMIIFAVFEQRSYRLKPCIESYSSDRADL